MRLFLIVFSYKLTQKLGIFLKHLLSEHVTENVARQTPSEFSMGFAAGRERERAEAARDSGALARTLHVHSNMSCYRATRTCSSRWPGASLARSLAGIGQRCTSRVATLRASMNTSGHIHDRRVHSQDAQALQRLAKH